LGEINDAVTVLEGGGIVLYPTDTVYGIGADIRNESAVLRVFNIKNREYDKAISIVCAKKDVEKYAEVDFETRKIVEKYLPGPVTLILRKKDTVPKWITRNEFVGIRVIGEPFVKGVTKKLGAITTTSANRTGEPAPNCMFNEMKKEGLVPVSEWIKEQVDLVVDHGETKIKAPSTIIKIDEGKMTLVREGAVKIEEGDIAEVLDGW